MADIETLEPVAAETGSPPTSGLAVVSIAKS